jgi:hypothetical protein
VVARLAGDSSRGDSPSSHGSLGIPQLVSSRSEILVGLHVKWSLLFSDFN